MPRSTTQDHGEQLDRSQTGANAGDFPLTDAELSNWKPLAADDPDGVQSMIDAIRDLPDYPPTGIISTAKLGF